MVKAGWLAVVFAVGIAVGMFIERGRGGAPAAAERLNTEAPSQAMTQHPAPAATAPAATAPPATSIPSRPAGAFGAGTPGARPPAATAPAASSADVGDLQAIDVGPIFSQQFADSTAQGYRDAMAEAHHALERETRDDSWAYPMEAEIENSLVADTSMGNFKKEHLECRASMCEVRLTARGADQAAALQRWNDNLHSQPWSPRLFMSSSSVSNNDNNVDALMIFTKPPSPKKD